eukprot:TRINITY_DN13572_c0_g2_i3.p1 TRINITY_DN13572_c0_g2~~TRINITY_DN13572_c0_g2_i3.p1  ORF type:complete len:2378 (+),score=928.85 TRINITY_DN13572_c0_g2_i3:65-7135(+)
MASGESQNVTVLKTELMNIVAAGLIREPKFDVRKAEPHTLHIVRIARTLSKTCPEFILKLALYVRLDLNIRVTANLLGAIAATTPLCMPYLRAYLPKLIVLPTDWVQIAQISHDLVLAHGQGARRAAPAGGITTTFQEGPPFDSTKPPVIKGLPTALRKALVDKFPEFNEYQLAKHDKERSMIRRNRNKKRKAKDMTAVDTDSDSDSEAEDDEDEEESRSVDGPRVPPPQGRMVFTIKRLIRHLHISEPVYHVMCITGQKYPGCVGDFDSAGLPGQFDPSRAGKRMKLATPNTWEVHLSQQGNKAAVWEGLLDSTPPLPFMAMMRNLRNFLLTGISPEHHAKVMERLRNPEQVMASKQFPHQFFAAYEAVNIDLETVFLTQQEKEAVWLSRGKKVTCEPWMKKRKVPQPVFRPTEDLIAEYQVALDEASRLSTMFNINPIYGKTLVMCDIHETRMPKGSTGVGSVSSSRGLSMLLSLMFQYASEDCEVRLYDSELGENRAAPRPHSTQILANMGAMETAASDMQAAVARRGSKSPLRFPYDVLNRYLREEKPIDNLIVIAGGFVGGSSSVRAESMSDGNPFRTGGVPDYLRKMRQTLNPDLLYVSVGVAGKDARRSGREACHIGAEDSRDVYIAGFSDSILKFVSERRGAQLEHVDRMDEAKGVRKEKINYDTLLTRLRGANPDASPRGAEPDSDSDEDDSDMESDAVSSTECTSTTNLTATSQGERRDRGSVSQSAAQSRAFSGAQTECAGWKTIRIFVSSTFVDMQTERRILASRVFPTLRRWCAIEGIKAHIEDIDLRWGITQSEAEKGLSPSICLSHVEACKPFFVGLVGDRYGGAVPSYQDVKPDAEILGGRSAHCFHWLSEARPGKSLTELEMLQGALGVNPADHAFFYLRDQEALLETVPQAYKHVFESESPEKAKLSAELRETILRKGERGEGVVSVRNYSARCCVNSAELTGEGLQAFEQQVAMDLWRAILEECRGTAEEQNLAAEGDGEEEEETTRFLAERDAHVGFCARRAERFCGRRSVMSHVYDWVQGKSAPAAATQSVGAYTPFTSDSGAVVATDPNVFLLLGDEGSGKSSVAAALCRRLQWQSEAVLGDETIVIPHFVGCTPASCHPDALLLRLVTEFRILLGDATDSGEMDTDMQDVSRPLQEIYTELLQRVEKVFKVVVCIDSIDRLEPHDAALKMFASLVPSRFARGQVRFFLTSAPRSWAHLALAKRAPPPCVRPMPDMPVSERKELIKKTLRLYGKNVEENYTRKGGVLLQPLAKKTDAKIPEYLAVVLEYLRMHATHVTLGGMVRDMPPTLPKLMDFLMTDALTQHGLDKGCAGAVLAPLALSYESSLGLSLTQLQDFSGYGVLPVLTLLSVLPHHIVTYDPALGAYRLASPAFARAVKKAYCRSKAEETSMHKRLALLLLKGATKEGAGEGAYTFGLLGEAEVRSVLQHASAGQHWELLEELLSDLRFIETCAALGLVHNLLTTLDDCLRANKLLARRLGAFMTFIASNVHLLESYPMIVHQCAFNSADEASAGVRAAAKALSEADEARVSWFQRNISEKYLSPPLCTRVQKTQTSVCTVGMSRDGRFVGLGCADWTVRVSTQREGRHRFTLKKHTAPITALAFSPMSDVLVSVSQDKAFVMWSLQDGAVLWHRPDAHFKPLTSVFVAKSGECFVTGGDDARVNIWDISSRKRVKNLTHHTGPVTAVKDHVEGRLFASASWDRTIRLYVAPGKEARCIGVIQTRLKAIRDIAWVPTLVQVIACCSCDGRVKVFDASTRDEMTHIDRHYGRAVNSVSYSNDGKFMVTGDAAGCLKVWRAGVMENHIVTCTGHHKGVSKAVFAPDNRTVVSGSRDGDVRSWHRERSATQSLHEAKVTQCVLMQNGDRVVSASKDGSVKVTQLDTEKTLSRFVHRSDDNIDNQRVSVTCLDVSGDGNFILSGCTDGGIRVWPVSLASTTPETSDMSMPAVSLRGHRNVVSGIKWVGEGGVAAFITVSWDRSIKRWHLRQRLSKVYKEMHEADESKSLDVQRKDAHAREITGISMGGETFATVSFDCSVRVWRTENLAPIRTLQHGSNWSVSCAYHPADPALLASVSYDGWVCLWDLAQPSQTALITSHKEDHTLSSVDFLAKDLLVAGGEQGLRVYRVKPTQGTGAQAVVCTAIPVTGSFFTTAPVAALSVARAPPSFTAGRQKKQTQQENRLVYCGDVLGNGYCLTFHDVKDGVEWSVKALASHNLHDEVPKDTALIADAAAANSCGESTADTESTMESYTTWQTVDPAEVYPGRGGLFNKFATGADRKKYLMETRNEYLQSLKNRGNPKEKRGPPQPMSGGAKQHFDQSVKTAEVFMMMQKLGIM